MNTTTITADDVEKAVWARSGKRESGEVRFLAFCHDDHHPSARWNERKETWYCDTCKDGGGWWDAAQRLGLNGASRPASAIGQTRQARPIEFRVIATYGYTDENGELLYEVVRKEGEQEGRRDKKFVQRRPNGAGGWIYSLDGVRRVPYALPELMKGTAQRVWIAEGEKCVDALRHLGLIATCNSGGAGKWPEDFREIFQKVKPAEVLVLPDNDPPGQKHPRAVADNLLGVCPIKILELPGLGEKGDVVDWIAAGGMQGELERLADECTAEAQAIETTPPDATEEEARNQGQGKTKKPTKKSLATRLVDCALSEGIELWHDPTGEPWATIKVGEHREHWNLRKTVVRRWLERSFHRRTGRVPNSAATQEALNVLGGEALFNGCEHKVHLRVAEGPGVVYLDLANVNWEVIEISGDGWKILSSPAAPIRFRRTNGMLPLPHPIQGGAIDEARAIINVTDEDWAIVQSWILGALRGSGPYPILDINGAQGCGKSTTTRTLRCLLDPNSAPLRALPREERDLQVAAAGGWIMAFDNLSSLPEWISNALCRLSTGGGLSTRRLFSDDEECLFDATRPVILNGIPEIVERPDLADRVLPISLPEINESARRPESELWGELERIRPRILGGLLDAASTGLRRLPETRPPVLSRMADFELWITSCSPALGWHEGFFHEVLNGARGRVAVSAIEGDLLAESIRRMAEELEYEGTATELFNTLNRREGFEEGKEGKKRPPKYWPATPRGLSNSLRRLAPALLTAWGVAVEFKRLGGASSKRIIHITGSIGKSSSPASPTSPGELTF